MFYFDSNTSVPLQCVALVLWDPNKISGPINVFRYF